jgi:23S rRNA (guanosine2251-2'-O)-methyltransferase
MSRQSRIVFGLHPVRELLRRKAQDVQALWMDSQRAERDAQLAELRKLLPPKVSVQLASKEQLDGLSGASSHQGVVAVVGELEYRELYELYDNVQKPLILAVDGVTDPQNLGAMLRSVMVLGGTGVVLTRDRCCAVTSTVVRISSGASEHLPIARVTNLARALDELKQAGVWVAGTVEDGGQTPAAVDLDMPLALVLGSEGKGMRPLVRKRCDLLLTIPCSAEIAALNVASATAIMFYEASRQRAAA